MSDLSTVIEDVAENPASFAADGVSGSEHSLPDLIAADRYLAGKTASATTGTSGRKRSGFAMLRIAKVGFPADQ